jgi:hypothetical protein
MCVVVFLKKKSPYWWPGDYLSNLILAHPLVDLYRIFLSLVKPAHHFKDAEIAFSIFAKGKTGLFLVECYFDRERGCLSLVSVGS